MANSAAQVVRTLLADPADLQNVRSVTTPDITYTSLTESNPELKQYLPWRGPTTVLILRGKLHEATHQPSFSECLSDETLESVRPAGSFPA
jgi:hypothetical protein